MQKCVYEDLNQAGLNLTCSKIPEDTFSHDVAHVWLGFEAMQDATAWFVTDTMEQSQYTK